MPTHAQVMELNIPAVHGAGGSRIYFVDRYREFSIYDVDFIPIPTVDQRPAATAGIHFFGVVQYIGPERSCMLQLVEPEVNVVDADERLQRIGLGVPDVLAAVATLRKLGVEFVETQAAHTESRGAITKTYLGSVVFELVHSEKE